MENIFDIIRQIDHVSMGPVSQSSFSYYTFQLNTERPISISGSLSVVGKSKNYITKHFSTSI